MIFRVLQVLRNKANEVFCADYSILHGIEDAASLYDANVGFDESVSAKPVRDAILKSEHVTLEVERIDLVATIWEHLIRPHRSGSNLVDVFVGVPPFAKNLDALAILELAAEDALASEIGEGRTYVVNRRRVLLLAGRKNAYKRKPPALGEASGFGWGRVVGATQRLH
ncbi:hypothetical protein JOE51_003366 [Bradyrhizobium japonicum]|uniref:Uncharacterized protein n=1 Tax=Bradyrhizobium diazoefficiens TaxID=1355477 RepID=A0A809ZHA6_9BRAD|nr:hypothetical protein [Bradyrhizobium japonicum]BBZ98546.1 hypothetical protein F07S3_83790 [Bradyrhizobium diazoefficiens]BCA07565.1 hypothetical protein H12S4_84690 [Bradyrhizobium diazoefficiens]BCA16234.1 hypothetical protein BDHF08_80810 [Bradyrhizobium diazoefficiens]BCA24918.1 hypothetical protein BDHH15_81330 [Bradyrhizobium diazoefficiens]